MLRRVDGMRRRRHGRECARSRRGCVSVAGVCRARRAGGGAAAATRTLAVGLGREVIAQTKPPDAARATWGLRRRRARRCCACLLSWRWQRAPPRVPRSRAQQERAATARPSRPLRLHARRPRVSLRRLGTHWECCPMRSSRVMSRTSVSFTPLISGRVRSVGRGEGQHGDVPRAAGHSRSVRCFERLSDRRVADESTTGRRRSAQACVAKPQTQANKLWQQHPPPHAERGQRRRPHAARGRAPTGRRNPLSIFA